MTQTHTHHPATFADLLTIANAEGTCECCGKDIVEGVRFCFDCGVAWQDAYYTPKDSDVVCIRLT